MRTQLKFSRAFSLASLFALGVLGVAGCGGSEKIVSVSGTVTHNGQAVPGLVVSFVPDAATETGVSTGETDDNGKYSLTVVKSRVSGAVVGKHKVWVSLPRAETYEGDKGIGDDKDKEDRAKARKQKTKAKTTASKADQEAILKVYGNLDKSPLAVEVKDGSPIDLKLD